MKTDNIALQHGSMSKIDRYNWNKNIGKQGEFKWILNTQLEIDPKYQRDHSQHQSLGIASEWFWAACGAISVCRRKNGTFFVFDGQHRVQASLLRDDITFLPCIVFEFESLSDEAKAFVTCDTNRRNVSSIAKYKANIVANDETTLYLESVFKRYGIVVSKSSNSAKSLRSVALAYTLAKNDRQQFELVIGFISELCNNIPIQEKLLSGIYYLSKNLTVDLTDINLRKRIIKCTPEELVRGATKSASYYAEGGAKIWAMGMLEVINSRLQNRYKFKDELNNK